MGTPRDDYETFFSPGGADVPEDPPKHVPPPPKPEEMPTTDRLGETLNEVPPPPSTAPPLAGATAWDAVGTTLIDLELVTADLWRQAGGDRASADRLPEVLDALSRLPSPRRSRSEPNLPAISSFQREQILSGQVRSLRLGPYLVIDRLGAGGMGEVFKAWNTRLDRIEALKVITSNEVTGSTIGMARFEREARVLAQLHHPCITTIYNAGREEGVAFIAMEYVRGRTLLDVVKDAEAKGEKVPVQWAIDAMREVASALDHAHSVGVIHRDVKPNNIMITHDGEVRVLDMGIARLLDPDSKAGSNLTRQVAGLGTPEVMPPEQWADASSVNAASDIYSLGCTLFYLLAGKMPFSGTSLHALMSAHLTEPIPSLVALRPDCPKGIDAVLARMLAKDPEERYASGREVIAALEEASGEIQGPQKTRTIPAPTPAEAPKPRWHWLVAASLLIGVGGAIAVWVLSRPDYAAEQKAWIATFQAANTGAWPSLEAINAAVEASPHPIVTSAGDFAHFKEWMKTRTEDQTRQREEFYTWLSSEQARRPTIWPSQDEMLDFVQADLATCARPEDWETVRKIVTDESTRRGALQDRATADMKQIQHDNSILFPDIAELESVANEALPLERIKSDADLAARRSAVQEIVKRRWEDRLARELDTIQRTHPDVWLNVELIREFGQRDGSLSDPTDSSSVSHWTETILRETWRRKSLNWAMDYQKSHADFWKSGNEIVAFIGQKFPSDVLDESTWNEMQSAVQQETIARLAPRMKVWAEAYQQGHADVWPKLEDLTSAVESKLDEPSTEALIAKPGEETYAKIAAPVAYDRVFHAKLSPVDDPVIDFQQRHFLGLLGLLQQLQTVPPAARVSMTVELEGKPVETVPLSTKATFTVTSSVPGYVTLIAFEYTGKLFIFQWDEPIKEGIKTNLVRLDAVSPGTDTLFAFVTERNLRQLLPLPPAELKIQPGRNSPKELQQIVIPPIQFEVADLQRIRSALPTPGLLDHLLDSLKSRKPPDYVPAPAEATAWGQASIQVRWEEKKASGS